LANIESETDNKAEYSLASHDNSSNGRLGMTTVVAIAPPGVTLQHVISLNLGRIRHIKPAPLARKRMTNEDKVEPLNTSR
jgi:hypothetical protein